MPELLREALPDCAARRPVPLGTDVDDEVAESERVAAPADQVGSPALDGGPAGRGEELIEPNAPGSRIRSRPLLPGTSVTIVSPSAKRYQISVFALQLTP